MRLCKFRDKIAKLGWKTLMPNQITYAMSTIALLKGRDWTYAMKSMLSWKKSAEYIFNFFQTKQNLSFIWSKMRRVTHFVLSLVYIFVISYHQPRKLLYIDRENFFKHLSPNKRAMFFHCIVCILLLFVFGEELTFLFPGRLIEKEPQPHLNNTIIYVFIKEVKY